MKVDCTDCKYVLSIGDGVRRSLIRHFRAWLKEQITTRELHAEEVIDAEAWRLADGLIADEERLFNSDPKYGYPLLESAVPASEYLEYRIKEVLQETKEHFLEFEIKRLEALIQAARGTSSS